MAGRNELYEKFAEVESLFASGLNDNDINLFRDDFLSRFQKSAGSTKSVYIESIKSLDAETTGAGVAWLQMIVDKYCVMMRAIVPSSGIFRLTGTGAKLA